MSGQVLELLPRTELDFSFLGTSGSQERVLVGKVPTAAWTQGTLMVRVHNVAVNDGNTIDVKLALDASTPEDPEHAFVQSTAITGASITLDKDTIEGAVETSAITGDLGYMVAMSVTGTAGVNGGANQAEISVVLVMKAS